MGMYNGVIFPKELGPILLSFWPVILLQFLLMIWALVDLLRRKNIKHLPKWAWALIIVFINLFGPIIYLVAGRGEE
jgi:hypothetical protein